MSVVFQHLDGKETCRIVVVGLGIEADEFFHTLNTLLYQHAVIYVYVAEGGLPSFIDFDNLVKQCVDSFACAPYGGYYWYSKQYAQLVDVEAVAACSKLVKHVERRVLAVLLYGKDPGDVGKREELLVLEPVAHEVEVPLSVFRTRKTASHSSTATTNLQPVW